MKILLSSGSLYTFPLEKAFQFASETGYDGMEVIIDETFGKDEGYNLLSNLKEIAPIYILHAPFDPIPGWGDRIAALIKTIELAKKISVPMVNFHPPRWLDLEIKFWRWMYTVRDFQKELGRGKVTIAMENMPYKGKLLRFNPYILRRTRDMVRFIEKKNLYFTFDCTHMGTANASFEGNFLRLYKTERVKNIHFSDYQRQMEHLLPGHGILPLVDLMNYLRESSYGEMVTLEIIPQELPEDEEAVKKALREGALHIRGGLT
ncbi:MAG: sugar phosphate isomerase/epimerase [Syntrophobacterales bacterium]|nr:MAG: sugar phosphate isomerase/epimerase [Syntrophobacterales bacterium]